MGSCFSTSTTATDAQQPEKAKVITLSGALKEYPSLSTASAVLGGKTASSSSCNFLCNSDDLYYDEHIPALAPDALLLPGRLYFVLPAEKLRHRLSGSDMAALAVKASSALLAAASAKGSRGKSVKVIPVEEHEVFVDKGFMRSHLRSSSRPAPVGRKRRVTRRAPARSRAELKSYRSSLNAIDEDAE